MLSKRTLVLIFGAVLGCIFVLGIAQLFKLRFDVGDVFPPYSSLRSDPLGTKAFYESLAELPEISASRFFEPLRKIETGRNTTLFIPGLPAYELNYASEDEIRELETFMAQGGRIVVTVLPETMRDWSMRRQERLKKEEAQESEKTDSKKNKKDSEKKKEKLKEQLFQPKMKSLANRWKYDYDFENLESDENGVSQPVTVSRSDIEAPLPESISWHSAVYFKDLGDDWRVLFRRDEKPVLIEKKFGAGSVVFAGDSYFLSNEALRKDRHPELLAWLVGANTRVIFNETHLGVQSDPGIAALARKYRLHGLIGGLVLLAGLFVWKNAVSFVPPHDDEVVEGQSAVVSGKGSASGFTNLLRRSISPAEILSVCFEEFKKSAAHSSRWRSVLPEIEQVVAEEKTRTPRERKPVESYQKISRILAEKKHL